MKLLTYSRDGADQVGVLASDQTSVIPLRALGCPVSSMKQLIEESTPDFLRQLSRAAAAWAGPPRACGAACPAAPASWRAACSTAGSLRTA